MKHRNFRLLSLCMIFGISSVTSIVVHADPRILQASPTQQVHSQYRKSEWEIQLVAQWQHSPFLMNEVTLDMHLTSPSGQTLCLPCYYERGQSGGISYWRARFTPTESGNYAGTWALKQEGGLVSESDIFTFEVEATEDKGFLQSGDNWNLRFNNGELFRGIGYNIGWEARTHDDSRFFSKLHEAPKQNYASMLRTLKNSGGNFFRTWMIHWNLPVDWKQVSNNARYENSDQFYNPSGVARMDELLSICEGFDVYCMLTIDAHGSLSGQGWKLSNYNATNGGPAVSPQDFFTDPSARSRYKSKLRYLVARWGYSPHIAVWEFFNEVDNLMYSRELDTVIPDRVVAAWHQEMADFLASIDPYDHPISTSVSHRDVQGMNDIGSISFNQKHIYRNTGIIPSTIRSYLEAHHKPYVIGEFAYEWDWSKNFDDFAAEMDRDFQTGLWYGLFNPTPILPLSWWWEYFENRGTVCYLKHLQAVNKSMLCDSKSATALESVLIESAQPDTVAYAVKAGSVMYLYLENSSSRPISGSIQCPQWNKTATQPLQVEVYDFATGRFTTVISTGLETLSTGTSVQLEKAEIRIYRILP